VSAGETGNPTEVTRRYLDVETPENVPLPFELAPLSSRFFALLIDVILVNVTLVVVALLCISILFSGSEGAAQIVWSIYLVVDFFARNFYFAICELRWQGRTVGKRIVGIRVIAKDGGDLSADMVIARNLTREIELFLPVIVVISPSSIFGDVPSYAQAVGMVWILAVALLPLFNKQRARVGDLIGGTAVVMTPRAQLLPDLVTAERLGYVASQFHFTPAQLEIYGIEELQVLEDVLRSGAGTSFELYASIAERIKRKIGWDPRYWHVPPEPFLRSFYSAQRTRLEQKMLMGKRQERKVR
jgi:uncharacterized RDD family membrane protein YckC